MSAELFLGLMSGTSMDGIDCALVEITDTKLRLRDFICHPLPATLKRELQNLTQQYQLHWQQLGDADIAIGQLFAATVQALLVKNKLPPSAISAIGSHGQTLWHQPTPTPAGHRFTWQLGDPNTIAYRTGITTIADFRRHDMAAGGQGAPLVPAFHVAQFASSATTRVVLNLGGIANITIMQPGQKPFGYDTGPANIVMNAWCQQQRGTDYDAEGHWAASGQVQQGLLAALLQDPYFTCPHPKSTGAEHFNLHWLAQHAGTTLHALPAHDVQATLLELTALSIAQAIQQHCRAGEIVVCGGGSHNKQLLQRLQIALPTFALTTTAALGLAADAVEATAFAWFAQQTLQGKQIDFTPFTGANKAVIAGGIYRV